MKVYCDTSQLLILCIILYNTIKQSRSFIKEKLEEGLVCMSYIPSERQLADVLTKGLKELRFHDIQVGN